MALVTVDYQISKGNISLLVNEDLVQEFKKQVEIFNTTNKGAKLNFDGLVTKIIKELKKINKENTLN